jgi:hypothetical protein
MPMGGEEVKNNILRRTRNIAEVMSAVDISSIMPRLRGVGRRRSVGKRVIKAGLALMAVPDPVTDVPGAALIAAGVVMSKYCDCVSIDDLSREMTGLTRSLRELRQLRNTF